MEGFPITGGLGAPATGRGGLLGAICCGVCEITGIVAG